MTTRKYNDRQMELLKYYKGQLVDSCSICGGIGYVVDQNGEDQMCKCMIIFRYVKELVASSIPVQYWHLRLSELTDIEKVYRDLVTVYLKNFDNALRKALGIFFLGSNGIGKTALMCEIAKYAIVRGVSVKYLTAQRYVSACYESEQLQYYNYRLLIMDEMDKAYIKEGSDYVPKVVEELFRRSFSEGVAIIAASNESEEGLKEIFGESTMSLLKRHLNIVPMEGSDRSSSMQESWIKSLKDQVDLYDKNIVRMALLKRSHDESKSSY